MSTSIDTAFIKQYEAEVHHVFQRQGSLLFNTVRTKTSVIGSSTTFQKIGKGVATTKARHGQITPMNQTHTAIECTLSDFYAGDWVDKLDEAKTNIDERNAIATGGANALGRKIDDQITTVLNATTLTTITVTVTSAGAVRAGVLEAVSDLFEQDVPNDGQVYAAVTAKFWGRLMAVQEFSSQDWVGPDRLPLREGAPIGTFKNWGGAMWTMHTGLPGATTSAANGYVWHKNSVGYGAAKAAGNIAGNGMVSADITWHGDRAAHFVNHLMSGGAAMIDTTGVIEMVSDDTAAVAST
jgi:hypothetical protein